MENFKVEYLKTTHTKSLKLKLSLLTGFNFGFTYDNVRDHLGSHFWGASFTNKFHVMASEMEKHETSILVWHIVYFRFACRWIQLLARC